MTGIREHLTYANVVSTLCLFVLLGGGAYAASRIDGRQIQNRSITGQKIKRDSLGPAAVKESSLGRVPRARAADRAARADLAGAVEGVDLGALVRGRAAVSFGRLNAALGDARTFDTSVGRFELNCPGGVAGSDVRYRNTTSAPAEVWRTRVGPGGDTSSLYDEVPSAGPSDNVGLAFAEPQLSVIKAGQGPAFVELRAHQRFAGGRCRFDWQFVAPQL